MGRFAFIKKLEFLTFKKVRFYSVQFEDKDETEFEDFLRRHNENKEFEEDLDNLLIWLENIGEKRGAKEYLFRHEGYISHTVALPPSRKVMKSNIVEGLRLYCMRLNNHVVILYNGGWKTTNDPNNCPNVKKYFIEANHLTQKIDQLIQDKEINWNEDQTDIIIDKNTEIWL